MIYRKENWRPVPDWPLYEVSRRGRVRKGGRILLSRKMASGYHYVTLIDGKRRKDFRLHRLVLLAWKGDCPQGKEACHNDGNKDNNALFNLRYDTREGNWEDKRRHGKAPMGSRHYAAKLTEEDVVQIKHLLSWGMAGVEIAKLFNVIPATICSINVGRSWRHI